MEIKLTKLEIDVLKNGYGKNEYTNDPLKGEPVWTWSIQPNCLEVRPDQISGVISSLVQKGIVYSQEYDDGEQVVGLTPKGIEILKYDFLHTEEKEKIPEVIPDVKLTKLEVAQKVMSEMTEDKITLEEAVHRCESIKSIKNTNKVFALAWEIHLKKVGAKIEKIDGVKYVNKM